MTITEYMTISNPEYRARKEITKHVGVGRVVAVGPELVARSDSEGGELWYCLCVLTTNMNMFL